MPDQPDRKNTTTQDKREDMTKWIGIAVAAIVVLLLIGWLLGWFAGNEEDVEAADPAVAEEPAEAD